MTLLLVLLIALPITLVGSSLASSLEYLLMEVRRINAEGLPTPPEWLATLPWVGDYVKAHWSDLALNADRTTDLLRQLLVFSRKSLIRNSLHVGQGIVQVFLSMVIAYFFYRDGHEVARRVTEASNRVVGEYTQHLIALVGNTVRGVVYGLLGTALGQGIMAAIGFSIVGLPAPFFWALLVVLLSFIPVGPPAIWIGATIWLLMQESFGWAVFMAVWGLVGISGIDNVLRPYLISRNAKLSFLPVMLGVLGGIAVFGLIGIFLGPTLLAVGMNMVKEFASRSSREPDSTSRAPAMPIPRPMAESQ
jgi:predicted PurR-regulated permease PerM